MTAAALLYNFKPPKLDALQALCQRMDVRCVAVSDADQGKTLGAVLGLPLPCVQMGARPGTVPGEMLVLSGFSSAALDAFLDAFGPAGVDPVPLKAVVTARNLTFTGPELYAHLCQERLGDPGAL